MGNNWIDSAKRTEQLTSNGLPHRAPRILKNSSMHLRMETVGRVVRIQSQPLCQTIHKHITQYFHILIFATMIFF